MRIFSERCQSLSSSQLAFLRGIFSGFSTEKIPYAWLRNYEYFPEASGHDIDIAIRRCDWPMVAQVVRLQAQAHRLNLVHVHERNFVFALWFKVPDSDTPLHVDFFPDPLSWHGLSYVDEDEVFSQVRERDGFFVLRPAHEAMCSVLSSLLWGGFYKKRYHDTIVSFLKDPLERRTFETCMEKAFGNRWHPPFSLDDEFCCGEAEIRNFSRKLRNALRVRAYGKDFLQSSVRWLRHWRGELRTVFFPPGIVVAVSGPDGAGKSTILAALDEKIGNFFGETLSYHWRPALFPDIGVLLRHRAPSTGGIQENPHGQLPHNGIQSLARTLYYLCDFAFSWFPKIQKPIAKNYLVIFDRYLDDMAIDPKRYRLAIPRGILEGMMQIVPRPHLMFVLTADADILLTRKQEAERSALVDLLGRYKSHYSLYPETIFVDAERPVAESVTVISNAICDCLTQRLPRISSSFPILNPDL